MKSRTNPPQPKAQTSTTTSPAFSYDSHRGTDTWRVVEKAIDDLVENNDIAETTRRDYIVGYICKELEELEPKGKRPK